MANNTYNPNTFEVYRILLNPNTRLYEYNPDNLDVLTAQMFFPEVVPAGSRLDWGQRVPLMGKAFESERPGGVTRQDRAHYTPAGANFFTDHSQIAYTPNYEGWWPNMRQKSTMEEQAHVWANQNGMQPLREMFVDLALYGGSGQQGSYVTKGSFENMTHGLDNILNEINKNSPKREGELTELVKDIKKEEETKKIVKDLGLTDKLVDFNGDGTKDYNIPVLDNKQTQWHTPVSIQYWQHAYGLGKINEEDLLKATKKVREYQKSLRNDAYYDKAWNKNKDWWAEGMRDMGFTDGGDFARILNPLTTRLGNYRESKTIETQQKELNKKRKDLDKAFKDKKISKEKYEKDKYLYGKAQESIDRHKADIKESIKATNTVDDVLGATQSVINAKTNNLISSILSPVPIALSNPFTRNLSRKYIEPTVKKAIKKGVYGTTDYVMSESPQWFKDLNKKANPYAKKAITTIWNKIPSGSFKEGLKSNTILKAGRDWLKRYVMKNGGVLNIQDILIY